MPTLTYVKQRADQVGALSLFSSGKSGMMSALMSDLVALQPRYSSEMNGTSVSTLRDALQGPYNTMVQEYNYLAAGQEAASRLEAGEFTLQTTGDFERGVQAARNIASAANVAGCHVCGHTDQEPSAEGLSGAAIRPSTPAPSTSWGKDGIVRSGTPALIR